MSVPAGPERAVLKWTVTIDDGVDWVGAGRVVHVGQQPRSSMRYLQVWTEEDAPSPPRTRAVRVFGTGVVLPAGATHVGSVICGTFVWHVYDVTEPA